MRFCPFCNAENADETTVCETCGRRLPPLPPRRARNAPPTGVLLPQRAHAPPPPRSGTTIPPPTSPQPAALAPQPAPVMTPGAPPASPIAPRAARPSQPPPLGSAPRPIPSMPERAARPSQPPPISSDASALRHAISPGPAAQRRELHHGDERDPLHARRQSDQSAAERARPPSNPPPLPRSKPPSHPPSRPLAAVGFDDDFNTMPSASAYEEPINTIVGPPIFEASEPVVQRASSAPPVPAPRAPSSPPVPATPLVSSPPVSSPPASASPLRAAPSPAAPRPKTPSSAPLPGRSALPPPVTVEPTPIARAGTDGPPPTRIQRPEQLADRPFTPPKVDPIPEIPEPGLINAARYAVRFGRARFQRRGAIRTLGSDIKQDTEALDQVLGALGRAARGANVDNKVFSAENAAITAAEERSAMLGQEHADVDGRKLEENSKFLDIETERNTKLHEAERGVDETQKELSHLEGQRRGLRDRRKELERRQKAYLKAAEDAERQAGNSQMGETRQDLRRAAEQHRKEAAALEPERQDIDRRLGSLERPLNEATARLDAGKAELDAAKRSLADAREGHTHRLAELDAEQKRKSREIALAEAEISRRLVTLGTLVNLNRIEDVQFGELYQRIDRLRTAITARTTEIEKLTAEREAYDRGTLVRGISTIGGAFVAFIALISILRAIL